MKLKAVFPEDRGRGATASTDRESARESAREDAVAQRALADYIDRSPRVIAQRRAMENIQAGASIASTPNRTGLPDQLKSGIEQLSGVAMDDVKVHYNSSAPAQLQAHAYAQGSAIHVGPGQEHHLPHEAWHVAQQKQGRVQSNAMAGGVAINDDPALEREADAMGARAARHAGATAPVPRGAGGVPQRTLQRVKSKGLKNKLKGALIKLSEVDAFQSDSKLSDTAIEELFDNELLDTAMALGGAKVERFGDDFLLSVKAAKTNRDSQQMSATAAAPRKTIVDVLEEEAGLAPLYGAVLKSRESEADLRAIVKQAPAHIEQILQCAAAGENRLTHVTAMLATNIHGYNVPSVLTLAGGANGALTVQAALQDSAHENNLMYLEKWVAWKLTAASSVQMKYLVRFQARLELGGASLTKQKDDKPYQQDSNKRTGFLKYAFGGGTTMYIHTHWNLIDMDGKKAMTIYSSHVQDAVDGENGLEINQWSPFANVSQAILAGQNAANPTGGPLAM
ncbi:DUF4157 domain-containing protein [Massilia sp. CFBP9012]|uniref:eCIS core domain-containing protein n=1 Tax=Massilia sp. CFBP9012 TaxID=3096531 RepID=UPI002A69D332|nr:DUF4157 domain-containing protein [Massilia sp. CFBP9012]MDY0975255.1 DUF4157 domain-containing protein [Massilia sp. CFBP9012]